MKKLIAGNWKMNMDAQAGADLMHGIVSVLHQKPSLLHDADVVICPPFVYLQNLKKETERYEGEPLRIGAQDCAASDNGAYTGDISAAMLKDIGCASVILGHSERRQYHEETDQEIKAKTEKAHAAGLQVILCVGETLEQREAGDAEKVVGAQLDQAWAECSTAANLVIAYEPVWAIGTGKTASLDDIKTMHGFIRGWLKSRAAALASVHILYGGSVKPGNAQDILHVQDVDGALVGGASLKIEDFTAIIQSAAKEAHQNVA